MSTERYAALAARLLRQHRSQRTSEAHARARGLATIESALASRQRRRVRRRRLGLGALALMACGFGATLVQDWRSVRAPDARPAVVVLASPTGSGASLVGWNGERSIAAPSELTLGSRVSTPARGGARLDMSTGTHIELGAEAVLSLQSHTELQRFSLIAGTMTARVTKLGPSERFVVDTPDAQAEVRGTAFTLEVLTLPQSCRGGARTRLEVHEGVVEVRAQGAATRVAAGEHWPRDCSREPATVDEKDARTQSTPELHEPSHADVTTPLRRASSLGDQNDLFERAARAERRGETRAALAGYESLIERYPDSALAEDALAGRMRVLRTSDVAAARQTAELYLQRYPVGFAREEARRLVQQR